MKRNGAITQWANYWQGGEIVLASTATRYYYLMTSSSAVAVLGCWGDRWHSSMQSYWMTCHVNYVIYICKKSVFQTKRSRTWIKCISNPYLPYILTTLLVCSLLAFGSLLVLFFFTSIGMNSSIITLDNSPLCPACNPSSGDTITLQTPSTFSLFK